MKAEKDKDVLHFFQIKIRLYIRFQELLNSEVEVFEDTLENKTYLSLDDENDFLQYLIPLQDLENIFLKNMKRMECIQKKNLWTLEDISEQLQMEYKDLYKEIILKKDTIQEQWNRVRLLLKEDYLRANLKKQLHKLDKN